MDMRKKGLAAFAAAAGVAAVVGMASSASASDVRVLLTGAPGGVGFSDPQAKLTDTGLFAAVDTFDASTSGFTPTLSQLMDYDAVMVWSNGTYASDVELGDVLADYVDEGGGVVLAVFTTSTTTAGRSLLGRFDSEGYWIIQPRSGNTSGLANLGTIHDPEHPTMDGVSSLLFNGTAFLPSTTTLAPHGELIASWDDGRPLVTVSREYPNRVDLGMFPPSEDANGNYWQTATDGARLMANALLYTAGSAEPPCIADWNGDGEVDVNDFFAYLSDFEDGDPRADLNNDGEIDINDFFIFLTEFEAGC